MPPPGDLHARRQAKIIQYLGTEGEDKGHGEVRGEVAIIDNDNVGLDGGDVFVWVTENRREQRVNARACRGRRNPLVRIAAAALLDGDSAATCGFPPPVRMCISPCSASIWRRMAAPIQAGDPSRRRAPDTSRKAASRASGSTTGVTDRNTAMTCLETSL